MESEEPKVDARKKPDLWLRPPSYQPSKAELEEELRIDATPDEVAAALMRDVNAKHIGIDDAADE